ncbi:bifunctional folylpolyglutamate synthase/dihydrofolate synthase [Anaerorhabdus sp.]|uniref:bifunctional folylpolyglutamate synthase/dihydrofolate synthase n=1 Tax=Anaerorhabdus sp. TaxID=1872524 RepID=UPI002FC768DE
MLGTILEANEWIMKRKNIGLGHKVFCELMNDLGNPQDNIPSIHIAGTNGKGSTVTYIKDCLVEAGYKVGTFTSPHILKHQDRIRINGKWIDDESFLRLLNHYLNIIEEKQLNMFDIDMLIACAYFNEENVDIAIYEVGLGGRIDCTNCLSHPLVSVITSIGLDHMELLGDTVEKIAKEKAGIIKKGVPCIIGEMIPSVKSVIEEIAVSKQSELIESKKFIQQTMDTFEVDDVCYKIYNSAKYQMRNATVALTVIDCLQRKYNYEISIQNKIDGILKSHWEGRFEIIQKQPTIILDGAHNQEGISALLESIYVLPRPWIFVFSALKDKPAKSMIEQIHEIADELIVTEFDFYRVERAKNLKLWDDILCVENTVEAINKGIEDAHMTGSCILCGSLYFISEARRYLMNRGDSNE